MQRAGEPVSKGESFACKTSRRRTARAATHPEGCGQFFAPERVLVSEGPNARGRPTLRQGRPRHSLSPGRPGAMARVATAAVDQRGVDCSRSDDQRSLVERSVRSSMPSAALSAAGSSSGAWGAPVCGRACLRAVGFAETSARIDGCLVNVCNRSLTSNLDRAADCTLLASAS